MKIALLGSAGSSVGRAPFKNERYAAWVEGKLPDIARAHDFVPGNFQIWGCSPGCWAVVPRATRWFEVHRWENDVAWFTPAYRDFLRNFKGPVYTGGRIPEIQNHVIYPLDRMEAKFASYGFTSSLGLMLALAIDEIEQVRENRQRVKQGEPTIPINNGGAQPEEAEYQLGDDDDVIGLWGVDMSACTSADAKVLTADLRWIRADEVVVGQKLLAFDEEPQPLGESVPARRWRVTEVLEASRLTRPCYRLTLEDGRELICSEDHKWLTHAEHENRWREAKDLVTLHHRPDRPSRIVQLTQVWTEDRTWEAGYLAAAFDGEGHLSQKLRDGDYGLLRAGFSQRENAMSAEVLKAMRTRGFDMSEDARENGGNGDCIKYTIKGGRVKNLEFLGSIRPKRLLDKFNPENLGMLQKIGAVAVIKAEFIGDHPVIGLRTSTKTFICEGLASHNSEEYAYQRPGCQWMVLEAMRRGIGVYLPGESDLMRPMPVYGISEWDHSYIKLTVRARELSHKVGMMQQQMKEAETMMLGVQGEQSALQYFVSTWTSPYGMLPGMVIRQAPGTGLGSGITAYDGRPVERMQLAPPPAAHAPVLEAMAESPDAMLGRELVALLDQFAGATGKPEGAVEVLKRIILEREAVIKAAMADRPLKGKKRRR